MIDYDKGIEPKSISLEDVTEYLNELIDVSEQESQRVYAFAHKTLNEQLTNDPNDSSRKQIETNNGVLNIFKPNPYGKLIKWKLYKDQIIPSGCIDADMREISWNVDKSLYVFLWNRTPHFEKSKHYPSLKRLYDLISGGHLYQIKIYKRFNNEKVHASFLIKDSMILNVEFTLQNETCSIWDIYDIANPQDKKILLRDWLPIVDSTS